MKLSLSIKIVVAVSIALLCAGIALFSFMRLNAVEQRKDFDLYTLVPQDAVAVFETGQLVETLEAMNQMECTKEGHTLHVSELFSTLRTYLNSLMTEAPHTLSKQMNKVLISFHGPHTDTNQVLYCSLGTGDKELVEHFIGKYSAPSFPVKTSEYRGRKISIYPMSNGQFLAVCLAKDFLAISFQKRLLERAIDAQSDACALTDDSAFKTLRKNKLRDVEATLYVRTGSIAMGQPSDTLHPVLNLSEWIEFDLKFTGQAIYAAGINHDKAGASSLVNTLHTQACVSGFPHKLLPNSSILYSHWSIADKDSLFARENFLAPDEYHPNAYTEARDHELETYLQANADTTLLTCIFQPRHTDTQKPCAVTIIPLKDEWKARQRFLSWLGSIPREPNTPPRPQFEPGYDRYPRSRAYRKYLMPRSTLATRMTGFTGATLYTYACFYQGYLLIASDALSLSAYMDAMEREDLLQDSPQHEALASSLSPSYTSLLMADMGQVLQQPAPYARLLPTFFLRHADFFSHFMLAVQFTRQDGTICTNLTLLYNPENLSTENE